MADDPIVAEVRGVREHRAQRLGYDVEAIARDVREREKLVTDRKLVRLTPRKPMARPTS